MALWVPWAIYTPSTHPFDVVGVCGSADECKTLRRSYQSHPSAKFAHPHSCTCFVYVLSARPSLELSECKVVPTLWGDSWVNQCVQCSPEALGPKWLTGNHHRPSGLVWSSEDTLCGGRGDPLPKWRSSLVEAASRWPRELGECLCGKSSWCSWERLGDREAILLCECFNNVD
jgi:hypothetical protein